MLVLLATTAAVVEAVTGWEHLHEERGGDGIPSLLQCPGARKLKALHHPGH